MSDHYADLRFCCSEAEEAEELMARMLECADVKRVLMLRKLASGRFAFALERPTMTMPRFVVGTTTALNDDPHVGGCFVLEAAAMASFERDYGLRDHAAPGSACVMLAAVELPAWVVAGVILLVMCWLAIEAAIALEWWSSDREAEHDEDCSWHVKRHAPDPRRSGRF